MLNENINSFCILEKFEIGVDFLDVEFCDIIEFCFCLIIKED